MAGPSARATGDRIALVTLSGEIDLRNAGTITEAVTTCSAAGRSSITLDMGEVTFMDSQGLQALLVARQQLADAGGLLVLRRSPESVLTLLDVCGVRELFSID